MRLLTENKVVCHSLQSPFRGLPLPLCCEGNANDASGAEDAGSVALEPLPLRKSRDWCCSNVLVLVAVGC